MTRTKKNPGNKSSESTASPTLRRPANQNSKTLEPLTTDVRMPTPSQPSDSTPHTTAAIKSVPVKRQIRRVSLSHGTPNEDSEERILQQVRFAPYDHEASSDSKKITTSPNHAIHITKKAQKERTPEEVRAANKKSISRPTPLRPKDHRQ